MTPLPRLTEPCDCPTPMDRDYGNTWTVHADGALTCDRCGGRVPDDVAGQLHRDVAASIAIMKKARA